MNCTKCTHKNLPKSNFCENCGAKLRKNSTSAKENDNTIKTKTEQQVKHEIKYSSQYNVRDNELREERMMNAGKFAWIWFWTIVVFFVLLAIISSISEDSIVYEWLLMFIGFDVMLGVLAFILSIISRMQAAMTPNSIEINTNQLRDDLNKLTEIEEDSERGIKTEEKISDLIKQDIDDVIFTPKNRGNSAGPSIVIILLFAFIGIALTVWISEDEYGSEITPAQEKQIEINIDYKKYLQLNDYEMKWEGDTQYFTATVKNNSSKYYLEDIVIRIDFSKDKEGIDKFDTRYVTVDLVPVSGAITVKEPIRISPTVSNWWWVARIEDASLAFED